jgi:hypothetical protein
MLELAKMKNHVRGKTQQDERLLYVHVSVHVNFSSRLRLRAQIFL